MTTRTNTHYIDERQDWQLLQRGQPVRLRHQLQTPVNGIIDMHTDDGNIIWVQLNDAGGRRLIHRDDGYQLETTTGTD